MVLLLASGSATSPEPTPCRLLAADVAGVQPDRQWGWTLKQDPPRLLAAAAVAALVLPLLLLVRQWLGWTYVMQRLLRESVDYEESGWYDGQTWEKPLSWRERDLLVARHEVRPILGRLGRAMATSAGLMLAGASLCQAL